MKQREQTNIQDIRWFTDGASMAYPPRQRIIYWAINLVLYFLLNVFTLRLESGDWLRFGPFESPALVDLLLGPLNIFYFPSYIFISALIMAMLCTVPILIAKLYNFLCAIPFVLLVFFVGHNPILSLSLFVACGMASIEPLRFKSKFVAAVICFLPVLLYWVLFFGGENPEQDVRRWAMLYVPWALAFFISIVLMGVVILIGHFLRYRPGVMMPCFALLLVVTVVLFNITIGMEERDFQAMVSQYSLEKVPEYQDRSISEAIDAEVQELLRQFPNQPEDYLREKVHLEWRWAFRSGPTQTDMMATSQPSTWGSPSRARLAVSRFVAAQMEALYYIDEFLKRHHGSSREPDALYYKALQFDLNVNHRALRDEERLEFYSDLPSAVSEPIWEDILTRFGDSWPALEARYRLARLRAARIPATPTDSFNFNEALTLLDEAAQGCRANVLAQEPAPAQPSNHWLGISELFTDPPGRLTASAWAELEQRIETLRLLIGRENRTGHVQHEERLARFVGLDSHQLLYKQQLRQLTMNPPQPDPLIDNIELALARLEPDPQVRIARLKELADNYHDRDGGIMAMLELAQLLLEQRSRTKHVGAIQRLHEQSQQYLQRIISSQHSTYLTEQAQSLLERNPLE